MKVIVMKRLLRAFLLLLIGWRLHLRRLGFDRHPKKEMRRYARCHKILQYGLSGWATTRAVPDLEAKAMY